MDTKMIIILSLSALLLLGLIIMTVKYNTCVKEKEKALSDHKNCDSVRNSLSGEKEKLLNVNKNLSSDLECSNIYGITMKCNLPENLNNKDECLSFLRDKDPSKISYCNLKYYFSNITSKDYDKFAEECNRNPDSCIATSTPPPCNISCPEDNWCKMFSNKESCKKIIINPKKALANKV